MKSLYIFTAPRPIVITIDKTISKYFVNAPLWFKYVENKTKSPTGNLDLSLYLSKLVVPIPPQPNCTTHAKPQPKPKLG